MSPTAIRRAEKCARTSVRETVRPDDLPWPALNTFDTSYLGLDSMQQLLDHWRPGQAPVRVATTRHDFNRNQRARIDGIESLTSHQYVSLTGRVYSAMLVIEGDDPRSYEDLKTFPVPPSFIGLRTSWSQPEKRGRWHAIWLLESPVLASRPGSVDYLRRLRPALEHALGADKGFTGGLSRNPFYRGGDAEYSWTFLHGSKVTLTDLAVAVSDYQQDFGLETYMRGGVAGRYPVETLPIEIRPGSSSPVRGTRPAHLWQRDDSGQIQRNQSLFLAAQRTAFPDARSGRTVQERDLLEHLLSLNRLLDADLDGTGRGSLDRAEVEGIARSVAGYCARTTITGPKGGDGSRWTPEQRRRGGLARAQQGSAQDARALGQIRSLQVRSTGVELRRVMVKKHLEEGLTTKEIAEIEGVSVSTVRKDVRAINGSRGVDPTDTATKRSRLDEQAQGPEETSDPISDESPEDERDVRESDLDTVRTSEEPLGSAEDSLRRPETRRERGRRLREELRASDPDDTIWW